MKRARHRAEALVIEDRVETLQGEVIGWAEYSSRFELRLHSDRSVVTGAVARETMERSLQEGFVPLHRHVRARAKVREVRSRNRIAARRTFVLHSIEAIDAPADWPSRASRQATWATMVRLARAL